MNKIIVSLTAFVVMLGTVVAPSITFAQYGIGGGFIIPVVVPNVTTTPTPTGRVLGAATFNFTQNLRFGTKSNDVMELQKRLASLGYFTATPTGYFGPITLAAVKAFQEEHGIVPVSGFCGPLTRNALNGN